MRKSIHNLAVLQVSTLELTGGAARVAWNLHRGYAKRGVGSWMAVGKKQTDDLSVFRIPNDRARGLWSCSLLRISRALHEVDYRISGAWRPSELIKWIAEPKRQKDIHRGIEDFHYAGSWRLLKLPPERPDIVHCHNLHGGYFDLRVLPWLSRQVPVLLTLHDAWLLSGHCAHSFDCAKWKSGCGECPDLTIYPAVLRDATEYNWERKRQIYSDSRVYVATPSRWLMQKVEQSMLTPGIVEARVIPNGVDLSVFHPAERQAIRTELALPQDTRVLLFAANGIRQNIWKDYQTLQSAVALAAEGMHGQRLLFLALGENAPAERIGRAVVNFVPYQEDPSAVARYYQAADVYIHAARADTFPNSTLEALACGTPVIATAVGGVPEQIKDGVTGFVVPLGHPEAMAARVQQLLADNDLRWRFAAKAAESARQRFDLNQQVDTYLAWYNEIMQRWQAERLGS